MRGWWVGKPRSQHKSYAPVFYTDFKSVWNLKIFNHQISFKSLAGKFGRPDLSNMKFQESKIVLNRLKLTQIDPKTWKYAGRNRPTKPANTVGNPAWNPPNVSHCFAQFLSARWSSSKRAPTRVYTQHIMSTILHMPRPRSKQSPLLSRPTYMSHNLYNLHSKNDPEHHDNSQPGMLDTIFGTSFWAFLFPMFQISRDRFEYYRPADEFQSYCAYRPSTYRIPFASCCIPMLQS